MDYKKILKITGLILIIVVVVIGGYYLWKLISNKGGITNILNPSGPAPTTEVTNVTEGTTGQTTTGTGLTAEELSQQKQKLSIVIDTPIFDYWVNTKDNSLYYVESNGMITKLSADSKKIVSNQTLENLHGVIPSNDGSMALFELYYPQKPIFTIFSASTTNWYPLTEGTVSADFSPNNKELIFLGNTGLRTLDLTSFKMKDVQKMDQFFDVKWAKDNSLLFYEKSSVEIPGSLYLFDITNKTIKKIIGEENGLSINWSKNYEFGLKLASINKKPQLSLIDINGNSIMNMSFITVPNKCLVGASKIYCGIPKNIRDGIVLPDNYFTREDYFIDDIFELDLPTGNITKLFDGSAAILDIFDLKIKDGTLLFVNRYDNKLYSLKLD
ncbi:MAG: hypothetical protein ACYC3G_00095 [Minisyncoccota bacterium]